MAALTADETATLRAELGVDVDLADAQTRYDRLGSAALVVMEMLRERLAALLAAPASINVPGQIALNTAANITGLQAQLQRVADAAGLTGMSGGVLTRNVAQPRSRRR